MTERAFDAERDCHDSYYAAVAELRRRYLDGEPLPPEWSPSGRRASGHPAGTPAARRRPTSGRSFPLRRAAGGLREAR